MDYEQDLAIDPHNLAEEWLRHPMLYMKYSEELAEAGKRRDKAKETLDIGKAQLDSSIRKDPDAYNVPKVTETAVSNAILISEGYQRLSEEYNETVWEVNILSAAVRAFEQRKKALESLVQLYIAQYFAGPKEPQNLPEGKRMVDIARGERSDKQRESLQRKRG